MQTLSPRLVLLLQMLQTFSSAHKVPQKCESEDYKAGTIKKAVIQIKSC